jgi:hypothetical protein
VSICSCGTARRRIGRDAPRDTRDTCAPVLRQNVRLSSRRFLDMCMVRIPDCQQFPSARGPILFNEATSTEQMRLLGMPIASLNSLAREPCFSMNA